MNSTKMLFAGLALSMALVPASMRGDDPKFLRSSIYSVLVNSNEQNTRLDKEAQDADPKGYAETIKGNIKNLADVPKNAFPKVVIPEQFNDHNLNIRIIDFDALAAGISEADAKAARKKGSAAGDMLKGMAASSVAGASGNSESSMLRVEKVDAYEHAVLEKFLKDNKIAPMMVAKWFNYNPEAKPQFNENLILERGLDNVSGEDAAKAAANDEFKAQLSAQGFELLNNTFVVATNLRFRNNKALAKEISDLAGAGVGAAANAVGGGALGGLAALGAKKAAEAAANKLMKDMYSVTAVTDLYQLKWDESKLDKIYEKVLDKEGATLEDLLSAADFELEWKGQTKARSGVKKDKEKTLDQLAESATARAIDKALAKLQVEYEPFRTIVPVSKSADGFVFAKIGTKEGVAEGDEYEILEQQFDPKANKISYKSVGSAKVEKGGVWFNTSGADELIANAEGKEAEQMKKAQELGYTKLKAGKKDYSGYYLKLKKKKGKIED